MFYAAPFPVNSSARAAEESLKFSFDSDDSSHTKLTFIIFFTLV